MTTRTVPSMSADTAIARVLTHTGTRDFPKTEGRKGCLLPGPGISYGVPATCQTRVSYRNGSTVVTFTEFWLARRFRTGGPPRGKLHHSWRYAIRASGRIVSDGEDGAFPPNYAK